MRYHEYLMTYHELLMKKIVKIEQNDVKIDKKNERHPTKTINNWWETVYNCIQMLTKSNEMIVFYLKTLHFLWHWVRSWEFGMIFDWVNGDKLWWVDVERLIMITFLPSYLTKQAGKLCF